MSRSYEKRAFRSSTQAIVVAMSVGMLSGCGDDGGGKGTPGTDSGMQTGPDGSAQDRDGGAMDSQTPATDGAMNTTDTGVRDGSVDAGKGVAPAITTAQARQVGRFGADLRVDFTGSDADKDITSASVELFGAAGVQIGTERIIPLATPISMASGMSYVLVEGILEGQDTFDKAKITLLDGRGVRSDTTEVSVGKQPVLLEGVACDATFVTNRCGTGLGCKGMPAKCSAGEPPTLADVGYFLDDLGGRVVMRGTDPDGDVSRFTINFFGADGSPALVDLDGDGDMPGTSTFSKSVPVGDTTDFYLRFTPADNFFVEVAKVTVTVSDARATNNTSNEKSADRKAAPVRSSGQTCDPNPAGFDYCKGTGTTSLVCASTTSGTTVTSRCTTVNSAHTSACSAALVLKPSAGVASVKGKISASLWDPASGCTTAQFAQPDSVVRLTLDSDATKVTLSTDFPYTSFDTVLYVLTTCDAAPAVFDPRTQDSMDLWCAQDQEPVDGQPTNTRAKLELKNLKAGVYYIVVDSFPSDDTTGTLFQLDATVE